MSSNTVKGQLVQLESEITQLLRSSLFDSVDVQLGTTKTNVTGYNDELPTPDRKNRTIRTNLDRRSGIDRRAVDDLTYLKRGGKERRNALKRSRQLNVVGVVITGVSSP